MQRNPLMRVIDFALATDRRKVAGYVEKMRSTYPHLEPQKLARAIVNRKSLSCGLVGAVAGVGGLITLPVSIPADLLATWRIQAAMVCAVAQALGYEITDDEIQRDIIIIVAMGCAKDALRSVGIEATKNVTRKMIERQLTRSATRSVCQEVGKKVLVKGGQKSLQMIAKLIPLVGAPIGFVFDFAAAQAVGRTAIKYYS